MKNIIHYPGPNALRDLMEKHELSVSDVQFFLSMSDPRIVQYWIRGEKKIPNRNWHLLLLLSGEISADLLLFHMKENRIKKIAQALHPGDRAWT